MTLQAGRYSSTAVTDDGAVDTQLVVTMRNASGAWVNDARTVTLTVTTGPGILPGGKSYTFTPGVQGFDGKAAIEFRSYYPGTTAGPVSTATAGRSFRGVRVVCGSGRLGRVAGSPTRPTPVWSRAARPGSGWRTVA
ncbi:hypothetical protein [Actinoplanes siamensis]|nr:hypothetical protein [Actinoplanes siamensis]